MNQDMSRYEELRQMIRVGIEASENGEVMDGDDVFQFLQAKLDQMRKKADQCR